MAEKQALQRTTDNSVWARLAARNGMDTEAFEMTLRQTILPDKYAKASSATIAAFLLVADQYNLNPFTKEIFAFESKGGGITPIVSIDGWFKIMNSHPQFNGFEHEDKLDDAGHIIACTVRMHRKDRDHPIAVTEYMSECARNTEPWKKWPARMLRHKAVIQAARAAFGFAGIFDEDEGERIIEADVIEVQEPTEKGAAGLLDRICVGVDETLDPALGETPPEPEVVVITEDELKHENLPTKEELDRAAAEEIKARREREPGEEG